MKRKQTKTEFRYFAGSWTHHKGPVERVERDNTPMPRVFVNTRRYNAIQLARRIRLASFVGAPILRKTAHFTNNPS